MQRRTFLTAVGATTVGMTLPTRTAAQSAHTDSIIRPLVFDSTASLLDANGRPLTNSSLVAVWAEQSAYNVDEDGDGNAVPYGDAPIPLVASDDGVVGFGAPIVSDETPVEEVTLQSQVDRVGRILEERDESVVLVGHSAGGVVTTQVAEQFPDAIDTLVYVTAFSP